ncbi:uncharacterized protein LOC62_01G001031 [Vanrija pseudolonga]|uniref:Uncharacterized protein n=1 Tax=Vanrija pseudolonga TaxID=143232 RepID=A0AAF0Y0E3_9TREE|nr:hypothetical protein LOC62_01G001031 [Vanrija pseudolonga]
MLAPMSPPPAHRGALESFPASLGRALPPVLEASPPPPEPRKLSAGASLPAEILDMVLEYLDVEYHRDTLLALLRVSPAIWEPTARKLYRNVDIGADQVRRLFRAPISARTRLALSFIKFLVLTNVGYAAMQSLYSAALPNEPLFPSVTKVQVISTRPETLDSLKPTPGYFPPAGIFLFGAVDMCLWYAHNLGVLRGLAAQETLGLSIHCTTRQEAEYTMVHLLAQWNVKWKEQSVVYWYPFHELDGDGLSESLDIAVPSGIRVRCVQARLLVCRPMNDGPFDPIQPPKTVQFRLDAPRHACSVCGTRNGTWNHMDSSKDRTFWGERFTVATRKAERENPFSKLLGPIPGAISAFDQ